MASKDNHDDTWEVWGVREVLSHYLDVTADSLDDQMKVIRWVAGLGHVNRRTAGTPVPGKGAPVLCASIPDTDDWAEWCPDSEREKVVLLDIEHLSDVA